MPADRAAWVRAAREVLLLTHPGARGAVEIQIRAESGHEERIVCPAEESLPNVALSPVERDILRAVGREALIGKAIAGRIGRRYDSRLRLLLSNLCEREPAPLVKTAEGYRAAARC